MCGGWPGIWTGDGWRSKSALPLSISSLASVTGRISPRRATHFLLLRQEKVSKEKASRIRRPSAALRARCVARDRRGGLNTRHPIRRGCAMARPCGRRLSDSRVPMCMCRGAQRQANQETRMSEALAEFARLPPAASTAGCPGKAGVTDTRVAFSLVTFFWRSKRKLLPCRGHIPAMPRKQRHRQTAAQFDCLNAITAWLRSVRKRASSFSPSCNSPGSPLSA